MDGFFCPPCILLSYGSAGYVLYSVAVRELILKVVTHNTVLR
jgi:hypothetical protein